MKPHSRTAAAVLPAPPLFARGGHHGGDDIRGRAKRRHHHFSDKNVVDFHRLDRDINNRINDNRGGSEGGGGGCSSYTGQQPHHDKQQGDEQQHSVNVIQSSFMSSSSMLFRCSSSCGLEPPSRILDFLFVGGVSDATNAEFLRRENIVTILNVSREEYWSVDRRIIVHPFVVDDTTDSDIQPFFRPTFALLETARKAYYEAKQKGAAIGPRVLVHCQRGRSRSATIVLAYLIRRNGWTVAEALQYVTRRRPSVEPNLGFIDALRTHQESMGTQERTHCCRSLCLAVQNLARGTVSSAVHKFFEDHVGCVQEVMVHSSRSSISGEVLLSGDECRSTVRSSRSSSSSRSTSKNNDGGGIIAHSNKNNDGNTLCLVFFASAECVRMARRLYLQQPELFAELRVAEGKELKLTMPSKLIRMPKILPRESSAEHNSNCGGDGTNISKKEGAFSARESDATRSESLGKNRSSSGGGGNTQKHTRTHEEKKEGSNEKDEKEVDKSGGAENV